MSKQPKIDPNLTPAQKRALLEQLLRKKAAEPQAYPLSFAQQRLWFLDQLSPGNPAYNIPSGIRLRGRLNVEVMERALSEIVSRHASLRTIFRAADGVPQQLVMPTMKLPVALADLSPLPVDEREQEALRRAADEAHQPFDLATGPLIRCLLYRLSAEDHIALLIMHHIIADGWSMGVLIRELAELYRAFAHNQPSPLDKLPLQYHDFARWQREWLSGDRLAEQLSYWREKLGGELPILPLPTESARASTRARAGAAFTLPIPAPSAERVRSLARREGVTLYILLLAALKALLYRYSGETDILIGTSIANRSRADIELLIGFFVNTLVMRTEVKGHLSFLELLARVRETARGAYAHQDLPFEKIVEELQPQRDLGQTPFFQVMLVMQNVPVQRLELPGLSIEPLAIESRAAKLDLHLSIADSEQGLNAVWEYDQELFHSDTVVQLARHFNALLAAIGADARQPIARIDLIGEAERAAILHDFNAELMDE